MSFLFFTITYYEHFQKSCHSLLSVSGAVTVGPGYARAFGGKKILLTGPCFQPGAIIVCRFGGVSGVRVPGIITPTYQASCVTPIVWQRGFILLEVSLNGGTTFRYRGYFFIGNKFSNMAG